MVRMYVSGELLVLEDTATGEEIFLTAGEAATLRSRLPGLLKECHKNKQERTAKDTEESAEYPQNNCGIIAE